MENEIITSVKKYESDHFLISAFAPRENQTALIALFYLQYELSKIPTTVTEPMMANIRFQWWWDFVTSFYDGSKEKHHHPSTPFFEDLTSKVSQKKLHILIEAHEKSNEEGDYFQIYYALFSLLTDIEGVKVNSTLAQAFYLTYSLVNMVSDMKQGRFVFEDLNPEDDNFTENVKAKYEQAMELVEQVSFERKTYLSLYVDLLKAYLKELKKANYHPFDTRLQKRPNFIELKLFLKSLMRLF